MKPVVQKNIQWLLRLLAAVIMLQTLYFKFTAAEESVYIFTTLHMEPWGRIGIGVMELIASILILFPATTVYGALLGAGLMSGALFFHLTQLGLVVMDDGGPAVYICLYHMALLHRTGVDGETKIIGAIVLHPEI